VSLMIGYNVLAEQFGPRECVEDATEKEEHMPNSDKESTLKKTFGDFAPKLVSPDFRCLVWRRLGRKGIGAS
jgi:hypothetical protein